MPSGGRSARVEVFRYLHSAIYVSPKGWKVGGDKNARQVIATVMILRRSAMLATVRETFSASPPVVAKFVGKAACDKASQFF